MKTITLAITLLIAAAAFGANTYDPSNDDRARWTVADLNNWRTVLAAYKIDNSKYPAGDSLAAVRKEIEPVYIRTAIMQDAWGRPFRYEGTADTFRVTSAGPDGKFEPVAAPGGKPLGDDIAITNDGPWLKCSWTGAK